MPPTVVSGAQTSFPVSLGGTVPDANKIIDMAAWAEARQPTKTPILTALGKPQSRNQRPFFFGQSQFPAHVTSLLTGINNAVVSLTVAAGDGKLIQKNSVLYVYEQIVGSNPARYDYTTKEQMWVDQDNAGSDTVHVARAQGGTTAIAHLAGAKIEIGPPAEVQLTDHTISPVVRGFQYFNHFHRIGGGIKMDKAFQNMPTYEMKQDQLLNDISNETVRLKLLLEKALIQEGRQAGSPTTPEMLGGILFFIQTNTYNQAGQNLSVPSLETAMRDLWNKVDESAAKRWLMSMNTAAIFDTFLNPYRQATMDETQGTFFFDRVRMRHGTYDIGVSRWMPDGVIAVVDFTEMKLVNFEGLNWHSMDMPVSGDYAWRAISGDFSLLITNESSMGLIYNFNTDLDQYQGRNFLV